jgi:hypothetical protein
MIYIDERQRGRSLRDVRAGDAAKWFEKLRNKWIVVDHGRGLSMTGWWSTKILTRYTKRPTFDQFCRLYGLNPTER